MGHHLAVWSIIWGSFAVVGTILCSALSKQIADEFKAWTPWLAERLIDRAASKLPEHHQDRYREEWTRHVEETPGYFGKIFVAFTLVSASVTMSSEFGNPDLRHIEVAQLEQWTETLAELRYLSKDHNARLASMRTRAEALKEQRAILLESEGNENGAAQVCAELRAIWAEVDVVKREVAAVDERTSLLKEEINLRLPGILE